MQKVTRITAIIGSLMALAVLALAGSFCTDDSSCDTGQVSPTSGQADSTIFTYTVDYVLSPGQDPPDVYLDIYRGGSVWRTRMMSVAHIGSVYVSYFYQTTLPEGNNYGFRFRAPDDTTLVHTGPTVNP